MLSISVVVGVQLEDSFNEVVHLLIALVQIRSDASVQEYTIDPHKVLCMEKRVKGISTGCNIFIHALLKVISSSENSFGLGHWKRVSV